MTRWTRAVLAALTVALLPVGNAAAAGTPGLPSIGDPYYPNDGNTGYQVDHYDLRLTYQPGADRLSGTATILATTTQYLSAFSFDFGLDTSSVLVDNAPAKFVKRGNKLVVTPKAGVPANRPITVVVRYQGVPSTVEIDGENPWVATPDGAMSTAEPHIASAWFPCNDHPTDKATFDVSVAVPDGTQAISTGLLTGTTSQLGWTRWNWRGTKPQATYLQMLTIGHYDIRRTTAPDGRPFVTAYDRRLSPAVRDSSIASVERTPEVIAWESSIFGPYPFDSEGGVVAANDGSTDAEEFQSQPVYYSGNFAPHSDMYVVVHENAHQWFGDAVSVRGWRNIWLNEGFANYAEWLWSEYAGEGTAQQLADWTYGHQKPGCWKIKPGDPTPDKLLADPVYTRGAMTLQALRNVVGDNKFFTIVREWVAQHRYGNADTADFVALAKRVSGQDLDKFFQTWLFTSGQPAATAANGFPPAAATAQPKSYDKLTALHQHVVS
ncbi:M1 family metallopeptidase [Actinocrispum wychmicini]|uniref:Aminopeptidase N n=1 Tax=Actinocrispum wychmicini TaxID=1213861 RepID=A0A4R2K7I7_9PSEU|nr:M1 family metallopeptidase [Actinocrispum wychmicini]TCO65936.1 peptidase M1-like protein [Actinocrispum wychmicini]